MEMRSQKVNILAMEDKVTEENVMVTYSAGLTGEGEMYPFGGSAGQNSYQVRNGECIELVSLGFDANDDTYNTDLYVRDRDNTLWNNFMTRKALKGSNAIDILNQLSFNDPWDFEKEMMSWGYESFAHRVGTARLTPQTTKGITPTLKLSDGDYMRIVAKTSQANSNVAYASAVIRRYKNGSGVPYDVFSDFDGGVKSNKQFYNDVQTDDYVQAGSWNDSWTLTLNKSEVYQFFKGGVSNARYMTKSRILIDDKNSYNEYYTLPFQNQLPFSRGGVVGMYATQTYYTLKSVSQNLIIYKPHRFTPTIKVVKNTNKNLKVQCWATTTTAQNVRVFMTGIKHIAKV